MWRTSSTSEFVMLMMGKWAWWEKTASGTTLATRSWLEVRKQNNIPTFVCFQMALFFLLSFSLVLIDPSILPCFNFDLFGTHGSRLTLSTPDTYDPLKVDPFNPFDSFGVIDPLKSWLSRVLDIYNSVDPSITFAPFDIPGSLLIHDHLIKLIFLILLDSFPSSWLSWSF